MPALHDLVERGAPQTGNVVDEVTQLHVTPVHRVRVRPCWLGRFRLGSCGEEFLTDVDPTRLSSGMVMIL